MWGLAPGLLHIPVFRAPAPPFSRIISGAGWTLDGSVDFSLNTAGVECIPCHEQALERRNVFQIPSI